MWPWLTSADPSQFFPEEHVLYSLDVSRQVSDWSGYGMTIETRFNRLTMKYYEPVSAHLWGGVQLGHETITQTGNPLTAGLQPSGYFLGVMLSGNYRLNPALALEMSADYAFNNVSDKQTSQEIRLAWHELGVDANMVYRYRSVSLLAGVGARATDVDETATGTVTSTRSFRQSSTGVVRLGLSYWVDPGGRIGIETIRGAREATGLVFERRY